MLWPFALGQPFCILVYRLPILWRKKPPPPTAFIMGAACWTLNTDLYLQTGRHIQDQNVNFTAEDTSNFTNLVTYSSSL
jgi:hypothetical protein